jgi:hypothetical protein
MVKMSLGTGTEAYAHYQHFVAILVIRTLPSWYDLRQYQHCMSTNLVGASTDINFVPVFYKFQYQIYCLPHISQNLVFRPNTRTKLV